MTSKPISKEWMQLLTKILLLGPNFLKLWTDPITMASASKIRLCCFVSPLLLWFRFLWAMSTQSALLKKWLLCFKLRNYTWSKVKASKSTLRACPSWLMMRLLLMTAVSTLIHVRIQWALLICMPLGTDQSKNCIRYYENIYCFYFLRARAGSRFSRPLPLLGCCSDRRRN